MKRINEIDRENTILDMANAMVAYDWRLLDVASNFMVSLTFVYKSLTGDLKYIDSYLYNECRRALDRHKHEKIPRGGRY